MLLAGLEPCVIPVSILAIGNGGIVLLQARDDLGIEFVLQRLDGRQLPLLVSVFRLKVCQNLAVPPLVVAQPVIGVDALAIWRCDRMGVRRGHGSIAEGGRP